MEQKTETMQVTPDERELIESIRNYNKSFPDGYPELLWFAQRLFDDMVRQPYLSKQNPPPSGEGTSNKRVINNLNLAALWRQQQRQQSQ